MSVVTKRTTPAPDWKRTFEPGEATYSRIGEPCTFCGKPAYPPYVEWCTHAEAESSLIVCGNCCREVKEGLFRDFREAAARAEFLDFCKQPVRPDQPRQ